MKESPSVNFQQKVGRESQTMLFSVNSFPHWWMCIFNESWGNDNHYFSYLWFSGTIRYVLKNSKKSKNATLWKIGKSIAWTSEKLRHSDSNNNCNKVETITGIQTRGKEQSWVSGEYRLTINTTWITWVKSCDFRNQ